MADRPKITDAEFEIVTPAGPPKVPWWRRIQVNKTGLLIILGLAAMAAARAIPSGWVLQ